MKKLLGAQKLLRIYVEEGAKVQGESTWRSLLIKAREKGLCGGTVLRGFAGFGATKRMHTEWNFDGAGDFTMIVEIVDTESAIENYLNLNQNLLQDLPIIIEDVTVLHYSHESISKNSIKMETVMPDTNLNGTQRLLRIFLGESDKTAHSQLYWDILTQARNKGLAGTTVLRGIAGFGANSIIHEPHVFRLSSDLPIVIEIVDSKEKIDQFLKQIEPQLSGALVTEAPVEVRHYKSK